MRDPRNQRRYIQTRHHWLAGYNGSTGTCALCGQPVDTTLPGTHPAGPTIEHRIPIRHMRAMVQTWPELLALACDTSLWALAHRRCQDRQGQQATSEINRARNNLRRNTTAAKQSRAW